MLDVLSRKEAKAAGHTRYFTGKPCSRGHIAERHVSNFACVTCLHRKGRARRKATEEKRHKERARIRRYSRGTPELRRLSNKRRHLARMASPEQKRRHHQQKVATLEGRLRGRLRTRLNSLLRRSEGRKGSAVADLGCSIDEFKQHIENQFQTGMNWENWSREGWHLDHIRPLARFDLTDREQFLAACHYTNYQPLWAGENLKKGARS